MTKFETDELAAGTVQEQAGGTWTAAAPGVGRGAQHDSQVSAAASVHMRLAGGHVHAGWMSSSVKACFTLLCIPSQHLAAWAFIHPRPAVGIQPHAAL